MSARTLILGVAISLVLFLMVMGYVHELVLAVVHAVTAPLLWVTPIMKP